jgi:hypothetical protein
VGVLGSRASLRLAHRLNGERMNLCQPAQKRRDTTRYVRRD